MKFFRKMRQWFCRHDFAADTQITLIKCQKCGVAYRYRKDVDLFPNNGRSKC